MPTASTALHYPEPGTRDCRDCLWFKGLTSPTSDTAFCGDPTGSPVRAQARHGCVLWIRRIDHPKRQAPQGDPRPEPPPNW